MGGGPPAPVLEGREFRGPAGSYWDPSLVRAYYMGEKLLFLTLPCFRYWNRCFLQLDGEQTGDLFGWRFEPEPAPGSPEGLNASWVGSVCFVPREGAYSSSTLLTAFLLKLAEGDPHAPNIGRNPYFFPLGA